MRASPRGACLLGNTLSTPSQVELTCPGASADCSHLRARGFRLQQSGEAEVKRGEESLAQFTSSAGKQAEERKKEK